MTPEEWAPVAVAIRATWPASRFDEANAVVFYQALQHHHPADIGYALAALQLHCQWLPTVKEINECATGERLRREALTARQLPEAASGPVVSFSAWVASGTGEYLDGKGRAIPPSGAYEIGVRVGVEDSLSVEELRAADEVWRGRVHDAP